MPEIDRKNPLLKNVRFCRRIVPETTPAEDERQGQMDDRENKLYRGGGYILSRPQSIIPDGMKVGFELSPGQDMSDLADSDYRSIAGSGDWVPMHICTREMMQIVGYGNGWTGVVTEGLAYGFMYVAVRVEDVKEVQKKINTYLRNNLG